jgi:hypothetical protein
MGLCSVENNKLPLQVGQYFKIKTWVHLVEKKIKERILPRIKKTAPSNIPVLIT